MQHVMVHSCARACVCACVHGSVGFELTPAGSTADLLHLVGGEAGATDEASTPAQPQVTRMVKLLIVRPSRDAPKKQSMVGSFFGSMFKKSGSSLGG